jgi:sugar diacid utilization regulator
VSGRWDKHCALSDMAAEAPEAHTRNSLASSATVGEVGEVGEEVDAVLNALERREDEIAASVAAALLSEVDGYQIWGSCDLAAQFAEQCKSHVRLLLNMARTGRSPKPDDVEFIRQVGIRRADELSPLHVLLHGYRVGQRVLWEWIVREAGPSPEGMRAALALTARTFDYADLASSVVASAYLQHSQSLDTEADRVKCDLLEDLLVGRVAGHDEATARAAAMGLDPAAECVVAVAVVRPPSGIAGDALRRVAEAVTRHTRAGAKPPFVVARHQEVVSIICLGPGGLGQVRQCLVEAVEMLRRTRLLLVAAGVSGAGHGFADLARAYDEASRALQHVGPAGGVVALTDVPPFEYMLGLADGTAQRIVPAWARRLVDEDGREGGVLVATLLAYLEADLRIGRAAARLSVHPNTVQNRLRKIRKLTGQSTRHFADLLQLVTAVRLLQSKCAVSPD